MTDDQLASLLQEADAASPAPPLPGGVATSVRHRFQWRGRRRRAMAAAILLLVPTAGALSWALRPTLPTSSPALVQAPPPQVDVETLRAEATRLRAEADIQTAVAVRMGLRERREHIARQPQHLASKATAPSGPSERDKAALILLDHGDRLRRDLQQVDAALAAYRRAIELFPETQWAAVARQRIEQHQPRAVAPSSADAA